MGVKYKTLKRIKNVKIVRILTKPWVQNKLDKTYQAYLRSADSQKIKMFRNKHMGERCFIIGNGPSLTAADLDKIQGEYTFAANRIYEIFEQTDWRPWAYVIQDKEFMRAEHEKIRQVPCKCRFVPFEAGVDTSDWAHTTQIHGGLRKFSINRGSDLSAYISEDVSRGFSNGYTVTFISIQLAIYMGFTEIYLLGVDFNYSVYMDKNGKICHQKGVSDYFNGKKYEMTMQSLEPTRYAYQVAREYCDAHGITICNATRGGKLEVFERVDFDAVIASD